jgi:hypothetical protein
MWRWRRFRIRRCHMPTGCHQDQIASTRWIQQKTCGNIFSLESDVQGYFRHRQNNMARRGHKRDVQRTRTYAFGISPDLGSVLDGLREYQGVLFRPIWKLVASKMLLLLDRRSMFNGPHESDLGHQNTAHVTEHKSCE